MYPSRPIVRRGLPDGVDLYAERTMERATGVVHAEKQPIVYLERIEDCKDSCAVHVGWSAADPGYPGLLVRLIEARPARREAP